MKTEFPSKTLELAGPPKTVGSLWGGVNARSMRDDMRKWFLAPAKKARIPERDLLRRNEAFVKLAQKLAPHWLEESCAAARAADIGQDMYIAFAGSGYRNLFLGRECTSFSLSPDAAGGRVFFHKNRDNAPKSQSAFILKSSCRGVSKFIAVSDASVIACMMMVNDKGLAGSADCGGRLPVEKSRFRGMMNTHLLRHIAERASDCVEALEIIREFVGKGWYAGGDRHGTFWHFVDRHGKRISISCNSDKVQSEFNAERLAFSDPKRRAKCARAIEKAKTPISFASFRNVSRDPSICYESSISGMTVEVSRKLPDVLSCAWISFPARALGLPLIIGGSKTPLPLLDGGADALFRKRPCNSGQWETLERFHFLSQELLSKRVESLIGSGEREKVPELIDEWTLKCADMNLAAFREWPPQKIAKSPW